MNEGTSHMRPHQAWGHIGVRHVTRMYESCHIWMSQFTYECDRWQMNEVTSRLSHIGVRHVTRMNESCHTWMGQVTYEYDLWQMNEVTSYMGSRRSAARHTCEWVMDYMNESRHTWMRSLRIWGHIGVRHVKRVNESWNTWMSHVTHECVFHVYEVT